jgi:hypothetical protein
MVSQFLGQFPTSRGDHAAVSSHWSPRGRRRRRDDRSTLASSRCPTIRPPPPLPCASPHQDLRLHDTNRPKASVGTRRVEGWLRQTSPFAGSVYRWPTPLPSANPGKVSPLLAPFHREPHLPVIGRSSKSRLIRSVLIASAPIAKLKALARANLPGEMARGISGAAREIESTAAKQPDR